MAVATDQKPRSLFDLPPDFFDAARLLASPATPFSFGTDAASQSGAGDGEGDDGDEAERGAAAVAIASAGAPRLTCNACGAEFDSLVDQRAHFKSDLHRLNVKLSMVGRSAIKEDDYEELGSDSMKDFDLSSISGSEDEFENLPNSGMSRIAREGAKQKLYLQLQSGHTVSVWRSLLLAESEDIWLRDKKTNHMENVGSMLCVEEGKLIDRLRSLIREPRDKTHLRVILLASGGHFAGCVFDGNTIIAHKTFHRYVVRAKAGKKQSAKDGTGKAGHSAGSSLRRYNEAALKKEIQELLVSWKAYINCSSCILIYAPSKTRQLLYDGESPLLNLQDSLVRHVPMTVRRPTLKEAKRVYNQLTQMAYEVSQNMTPEGTSSLSIGVDVNSIPQVDEAHPRFLGEKVDEARLGENVELNRPASGSALGVECSTSAMENMVEAMSFSPTSNEETLLHEAAKSGNAKKTLELLEEGLNPCLKDERGRTPYMLASDKEVRNTFRRFMALNLNKWDWNAANVPSPLSKEMEESQAAKQAEKDAKRKAKAKELKKLRKAKEKAQLQAKAAQSHSASTAVPEPQVALPAALKQQPQSSGVIMSKEEEQRRALAEAREKRAAAAERRIAALAQANTAAAPSSSVAKTNGGSDSICSCCDASLAGKVPFHRYHYKYCSTSCMHVHREMLEDG